MKKFDHSNYLLNQIKDDMNLKKKSKLEKRCWECFGTTFFTSVSGPKFRKKIVMSNKYWTSNYIEEHTGRLKIQRGCNKLPNLPEKCKGKKAISKKYKGEIVISK